MYTCVKNIVIPIKGNGRYYLPDDSTLRDKKIISLVLTECNAPVVGESENSFRFGTQDAASISLTGNGQNYFWIDYPLDNLLKNTCYGIYPEINRKLVWEKCYIDIFRAEPGIVQYMSICVVYEDKSFSNVSTGNLNGYEEFHLTLNKPVGQRNYFPENRNLSNKKIKNLLLSPYSSDSAHVYDNYGIDTFITLTKNGKNIIDNVPLCFFNQRSFYKNMQFDNIMFDFEKSYVINYNEHRIGDFVSLIAEYER